MGRQVNYFDVECSLHALLARNLVFEDSFVKVQLRNFIRLMAGIQQRRQIGKTVAVEFWVANRKNALSTARLFEPAFLDAMRQHGARWRVGKVVALDEKLAGPVNERLEREKVKRLIRKHAKSLAAGELCADRLDQVFV